MLKKNNDFQKILFHHNTYFLSTLEIYHTSIYIILYMIANFKDKITEDIYNGINSKKTRKN